jgi:prepilin-type N-terminal cleavage/methylation domain-containing protein
MLIVVKSSLGYSLYELLIVLAIMAILMSLSVPIIYAFVLKYNEQIEVLQLKTVIKYAQHEALRLGGYKIIICGAEYATSAGVNTYLTNCATSGKWNEGILAYVDYTNNSAYNSGEKIKVLRFDNRIELSLNNLATQVISQLFISSNGLISDEYGDDEWIFSFSQTKFGLVRKTQFKLNSYGYVCQLGESGC